MTFVVLYVIRGIQVDKGNSSFILFNCISTKTAGGEGGVRVVCTWSGGGGAVGRSSAAVS